LKRRRLTENISVYLKPEEAKKLKRVAEQFGLSISDVARFCILYVVNQVLAESTFIEVMAGATQPKGGEKHD